MAVKNKKKSRRVKRQVRKTLGALFLASAVAVAAIPTSSMEGGNVLADSTDDETLVYKHVLEDGSSSHSEVYPIKSTSTAHSVYVDTEAVKNSNNYTAYVASSAIPMCLTGTNSTTGKENTTIYSTGDGDFQFAYVPDTGNQNAGGDKFAVILGYSHSGSIANNTVTIPDSVDAYLNFNDNNGSSSGFVAVGKSANFLFYVTDEETSYSTTAQVEQTNVDADGNTRYKVTGTDSDNVAVEYALSDNEIKDYIERGLLTDKYKKGEVATVTKTVSTYYSPCYYSKKSEWDKENTTLYYYPTSDYKPKDGVTPLPANTQTYERISNATVVYIGNQYLVSEKDENGISNVWKIGGTISSPEQGIFAGNSNIVNLEVGDNLSGIGDYAFYGCTNLNSVTLGNGIHTIGNHAFDGCRNMSTFKLPDASNLDAIGAYAFKDCQAFTTFTVPNSVTHIGDGAFKNCWNMESINLTGVGNCSLTYMGAYVFQNCQKLKSLTFPQTYSETIELSMFEGCYALEWIKTQNTMFNIVPSTTCHYTYDNETVDGWEVFKNDVTGKFYIEGPSTGTTHTTCTDNEIAFKYLDQNIYELTKKENGNNSPTVTYQIDESETLNQVKFNGTVTSLNFPDYIGPYSIKHIGNEAFKDHCTLKEISIASTIESIGDRAFQGCHNLEYVYFNTDTVSIGSMAFQTQEVSSHDSKCTNSSDMTDAGNNPKVKLHFVGTLGSESSAYNYAMSYDGRYSTGTQAISFIEYLSGWPTCITVQYNYNKDTGNGYSELVDFPTLTDLSNYASAGYLTPEQKNAASYAIQNMNNSSVKLTEDQETFINAAKSLTIPKGVDAIKDGLVYNKTKDLTDTFKVYCFGLNNVEAGYTGTDADGFPVVDPEKSDFAGCTNISEIYLYGDTATIAEGAFTGDTGLKTVQVNGATTTIGNHAFDGCASLTNVSLSSSIQSLGIRPFAGCESLSNVNFQDSENYVCDNSIIYGLSDGVKTKLIEVLEARTSRVNSNSDALSTVTAMEKEAFAGSQIVSADLKTSAITLIPERAFADSSIRTVELPSAKTASSVEIQKDAFRGSSVSEIVGEQNVILIDEGGTDGIIVGADGAVTSNQNTVNNNKVTIYAPEDSYLYKYANAYNFTKETVVPTYSYTVSFVDWNEELGKNVIVDSQTVERGEAATPPTPLGKSGQIFDYWEAIEGDYNEVYADMTVQAIYKDPPEGYGQHLVTYMDDDGVTQLGYEYVDDGGDATANITVPERKGYTFTGWQGSLVNITQDITVYAQYQEGYLVRYFYYDDDGNRVLYNSMFVSEGENAMELNAPVTKAGFTFTGWLPSVYNITEPTDTYAQYLADGTTGVYTVTYYNYDGSVYETYSVLQGGNAPSIAGPVRDGYTFVGWLPSLTNITADTSVFASYTPNSASSSNGTGDGTTGDGTTGNGTTGDGSNTGTNGTTGTGDGSNSGSNGNTGSGTTATETKQYYVLTVKNGSGSGSYLEGSQPIIVADDPASGLEFSNWTIEPSDTTIASKALSATVVTMPAENVTVTANYKAKSTTTTSNNSSGSGTTSSSNTVRVPTTTGTIKTGGTTVVIDKNGLSNTGVVSATVNGSSDNFTIKVSESSTASESAVKALMAQYGDLSNIKYFPMDITLYDSTGQSKITDTTGLSITITLPLPDSMTQYAGNNKIASVANDKLESLSAKFTTISGVPCITFTAEHFSPYVIYVDTNNLTAGTISDATPKTGDGIHPKWFLSMGLACISVVLFMKKDKKTPKKGLVKA